MKKVLPQLMLVLSAIWLVEPAAPIVSVFYCMSTSGEQKVTLMTYAAVIWLFFLVLQLGFIKYIYSPVDSVLEKLENRKPCADHEIQDLARRNSRLAIQTALFYPGILIASGMMNFLVYLKYEIGLLSSLSIWGAVTAGSIACPFMVLGSVSLITGPNTQFINDHLRKRNLDTEGTRIRIYPKLLSCFVAFAVGFAVWLGSAAYYTGINQTIEEIKHGQSRLLQAAIVHVKNSGSLGDDARLAKEATLCLAGESYFISDRSGAIVYSSRNETLDIDRWEGFKQAIRKDMDAGTAGSIYDNVNSRVIAWAPLDEKRVIGTFSHLSERYSRYTAFFIWSGFFIMVGFSVGFTLGYTNVLATSRSVNSAVRVLKDLADGEGDLKTRLAITSYDEVGDLARGFNLFTDKLFAIVKNIVETSQGVKSSSHQFSNLSKNMNQGAINLRQSTGHATQQASTMSTDLGAVAAGCDLAANTINQVAAAAEQMASSVQEVAVKSEEARQVTQSAVDTAKGASEKMSRLGASAKDIDKVTEVITEISEQTNLLALNATIEAARAGEAGRGFAVVANEIKDLARQTAQATKEIKLRITAIQSSTDETINDMGEILRVIDSVNHIVFTIASAVEEQSVTTSEIAKNISQTSVGISDVNKSVASSSNASQAISELMGALSGKADDMAGDSSQVESGAKDLLLFSGRLNDQLSKFKL
jgi:methyl-accepting chemotaxis protein